MPFAFCFALPNEGRSIPAKIAMIAMTTSSSIRVNALASDERRGERGGWEAWSPEQASG